MSKSFKTRNLKRYGISNLRPGDVIQVPMSNEWFVVRTVFTGSPILVETVMYNNEDVKGPTLTETGLYGYKIIIFQ